MSEDLIIVDRIESGYAVCETGGTVSNIPLANIVGDVREGDVLRRDGINDGRYTADKTETAKRRAAMSERFKRLKERGK